MRIEDIAKVAHETNRAFCETLGDTSQPAWEEAPDWQTSSAVDGVRFHLHNHDAAPSRSHENWLEEKRRDGWIYGPIKDPATKEHPCMVSFADLPLEQQLKDVLFTSVVRSLSPLVDGVTA